MSKLSLGNAVGRILYDKKITYFYERPHRRRLLLTVIYDMLKEAIIKI